MSEHLRTLLVQGVISETVTEIDYRLGRMMSTISSLAAPRYDAQDRRVDLAIFTCEHLLSAIVQARDPEELHRARAAAAQRMIEFDAEDSVSGPCNVSG